MSDLTTRLKLIAMQLPPMVMKSRFQLIITKGNPVHQSVKIDHYQELRKIWDQGGVIEEREERIRKYVENIIGKIPVKA